MIDFAQIRDDVINGLHGFMELIICEMEHIKKKPPYPFLAYKFIVPFNPQGGQPIETGSLVESKDPAWEHDYEYTRISHDTMTLSITTYSKNSDESHQLALKAHSWFSFYGYEYLAEKGIIVSRLMSVQPRDTLIINDYERRQGFDVVLRVVSELKRTVETIESVEIDIERT